MLLWLEELYPNYRFDLDEVRNIDNENLNILNDFLNEWELMKNKRKKKEIRYADYIERKLNYSLEYKKHE